MASPNPSGRWKQFKNQILVVKGLIIDGVAQGAGGVSAGTSLAMSEATHAGKTVKLDSAAGSIAILPASTGGGAVYRVVVAVTATSGSHVIRVANSSDAFKGFVLQDGASGAVSNMWWAAAGNDTITLNRSTSGLAAQGEYFVFEDIALNLFAVRGFSAASATEITPFGSLV